MGEPFDLTGKKALVVGLGDTGLSCARWLAKHGAELRGADSRSAPPHAERLRAEHPEIPLTLGRFDPADFAWAEMIVLSPGVPLATPEVAAARTVGKDIVGDVELFSRALHGRGRVLAVTGSNGKSTVVSLTGHLCETAGKRTVVAGNIGLPVLEALGAAEANGDWPEVWVLELSSFQLETTASLRADAATVLNISQDHLDRYAGLEDYAAAKTRIFSGENCIQVLNRDDPWVMKMILPGHALWTFGLNTAFEAGQWGLTEQDGQAWLAEGSTALLPVAELPIPGLHNAANALASLALCRAIGLAYDDLLTGLRSFKGLPHRVEWVAEVGGVRYYDDSKGTNVGATLAAITGFDRPVVLIAGGDGKGQDFSPLRQGMNHARAVVLIGRDAPAIEAALAGTAPLQRAADMDDAVRQAAEMARPGDAVLLSPACASFDMFRDYKHRAELFVKAVQSLGGHVS
ncbi:MAG TPA: UDP-N-acetylmuramoyl-L-alanine--D-glutamate ligase [Thiobacillaceae bacterium]|nr:UDP-N-acetylmuramoyl-L-alanine--D-glutamate ligase [Thiobacillaceae bacterium]